jgi:hypothetical protein
VQFIDRQDYMDWANREGRWADEMRIEHTSPASRD